MSLTKQAVLEIHDLTNEATRLSAGSASDRKTADVLLARVANIRSTGMSTDETRKLYCEALGDQIHGTAEQQRARHEVAFRHYVQARNPQDRKRALEQFRDMEAGSQTITYTEGSSGGVLVPNSFYDAVTVALSQTDPLLDPKNVNLIQEKGYAMRPKSLPGYDLSVLKATRVSEGQNDGIPDAFPAAATSLLNGYIYRMGTYGSVEIDDDDFEPAMQTIGRAHGVGLARGIGDDLVNGLGPNSGAPSGLLTGAANSGYTTANHGTITYADVVSIYFSLNRIYRRMPKCAWVMNDNTFQSVRSAVDGNGRPLISVEGDMEMLMGQPVLVSPSMPSGPGSTGIIFGDLSHFNVRVSPIYFRKAWEVEFGVENYRYLHISRVRVDSAVFNPATATQSPASTQNDPILYATLHS